MLYTCMVQQLTACIYRDPYSVILKSTHMHPLMHACVDACQGSTQDEHVRGEVSVVQCTTAMGNMIVF